MVSRKLLSKTYQDFIFAQPGCFAMKPSSTNHPLNFILAMPHPTQKVFSACSEPASNAGDEVEFICEGPDEQEALDGIIGVIESGLGE